MIAHRFAGRYSIELNQTGARLWRGYADLAEIRAYLRESAPRSRSAFY